MSDPWQVLGVSRTATDEEIKARAEEIMTSAKGRPGAPATFDELLAQLVEANAELGGNH